MKNQRNILKYVIPTILIALLIGIYIGYSQTPSSTIWISPGVYPGAPSYTVWREGSNYFAKNANGQIAYSGTNDTDIIISCIGAGGKTILLKNGIHVLSNRVMIPSNTIIFGEGINTVISVQGKGSWLHGTAFANENMMNYTPPQDANITLANLKITYSTVTTFSPLYFRGVNSLKIQNVIIEKFNGTNTAGIGITHCNNTLIEKCTILNGGLSGSSCEAIYIGNSNYTLVKDNYIQSMTREGIYVAEYSEITTVESNIIIGTTQGINIKPSTKHTIVSKNQVENATTGIYFVDEASGTAYLGSICENSLRNCEQAIIVKLSQGITVGENTIENCTNQAILLDNSTDCSVTANIITDANYGVYLLGSENNTIMGNNLYMLKSDNGYGILLYTDSNSNLCVGNFVREVKRGIYESGANYNIIIGCIATDCSIVNIFISGANSQCNLCYNGTTWIS